LYSGQPKEEEERYSAQEEHLFGALQAARRNIIRLETWKKQTEEALESERRQFDRIHEALKCAKSDAAWNRTLTILLEQEKQKNRGSGSNGGV
jgi:hypothetical protein